MSSHSTCAPLADAKRPEEQQIAAHTVETPLLDEAGQFSNKKRGILRQYGYWIVYCGSICVLSGLLVGIQQILKSDRRDCWDSLNAYCKRAITLLLEVIELEG